MIKLIWIYNIIKGYQIIIKWLLTFITNAVSFGSLSDHVKGTSLDLFHGHSCNDIDVLHGGMLHHVCSTGSLDHSKQLGWLRLDDLGCWQFVPNITCIKCLKLNFEFLVSHLNRSLRKNPSICKQLKLLLALLKFLLTLLDIF